MKKIIILIIFLLLTGCDYIELNDLSIIKSIAIDYKEDKYTLYAEIIDEINEENIPTTKIIEVNEKSIEKCFKELIIRSNKNIHYSHIDLLILSTNLTNKNLEEIFNYFLESKNFRNDFMTISSNNIDILITVGKEAKYMADEAAKKGMNLENIYTFDTNEKAEKQVKEFLKEGNKGILIKASNGMKFQEIYENIIKN